MTQDQLPMVALASMNDTHLEEMLLINQLETLAQEAKLEEIPKALQELLEHTKIHFSNEEKMMSETNFPVFPAHKAEHDRHLHELESVINYFEKHQEPSAITAYIQGTLAPWLINHVQTMDTITAMHLQKNNMV